MRRAMARQATAFALGCALAWPALSQGLFDDNEARRRVELLRQQVEASQKALEDRLGKLESSTGERSALLDLAGQLEGLRAEIAAQRKLLAAWPDSPKAPDAMLSIASAQETMGERRAAQKTLEELIGRYPSSSAATSAKQRLSAYPKR